ncbi:MAG: hypothetical protein EOO23_00295 [Comamonadaceae bacterium]|nr:MAG: hypothetical protein EOO23_00295 [Comamonadaceae bacterium]
MLLTLHIVKIESGDYRGHVMEGTQHLGNYDAASIKEAIMLAAENPLPDLTGFHIWYEHVCAGTTLLSDMRTDPDEIAQRLVSLHSVVRGLIGG